MWFSRKKAKPVQVAFDKKPLTIVQATDMHYITRKLTDNGEAFRKTADAADGKVLLYSEELMDAFCAEMAQKKPQVLILSGDLSFNGEYESHKALAAKLAGLKEAGTKVLVIPGNHDIDYAGAASFSGKEIKKARSISAQEFRKLYAPFGYNDAGDCAPDTLSYLTDLGGFRILMLDTTTVSMCRVTDRTLTWTEKMLQEAAEDHVPVLAVSHQNLMAHNAMFAKGFRIEGGEKLLSLYEKYGVLANLSGHMHLQHIRTDKVTEIATSALSLSPNQYGEVSWNGKVLTYRNCPLDVSSWAEKMHWMEPNLQMFSVYAKNYALKGAVRQTGIQLGQQAKRPSAEEEKVLAKTFSELNYAYFAGNRIPLKEQKDGIDLWLSQPESFMKAYIRTILADAEAGRDYHSCEIERKDTP